MAIAEQAGAGEEAVMLAAAALLGVGAAVEYLAYEDNSELPTADELLANPKAFRHLKRSDLQHAALTAVVAAAQENPDVWAKAFKVCIEAARRGAPDIAAASAAQLVAFKPDGAALPKGHDVFTAILDHQNPHTPQAA